jgi:hypothetical protein
MGLVIDSVIVGSEDVEKMSVYWAAALDFEHVRPGPLGGLVLAAKDGPKRRQAMFPVGGTKAGQHRVHFDLRPDDQR